MTTTRRLKIISDMEGNAKAGISGLSSALKGVKSAATYGIAGVTALGGAALTAGGFLVSLGSDAEEMESKFNVVFGSGAAQAKKTLDDFGNAVGRNTFELMDMSSGLQDILVAMGFTREEAAKMSTSMTTLSVDVGSFKNVADTDVMDRFRSGLVGNHDALDALGIAITEATLNQELMNMGVEKGVRGATEQEKVIARMNIIMRATKDAQGDAARTSESWANQTRALRAELMEAATTMGKDLLPVAGPLLKDFTVWVKDVMPKGVIVFNSFAGELKTTVGPAMLLINDALTRIAQSFGYSKEEVSATDTVLWLFKKALDAVVIGVKAFAIGMQGAAWTVEKVSEAVRIARGLSDQLGTIIKLSMDRAKGALNGVIGKWNDFKSAVRSAVSAIPSWLIPHSPTPFQRGLEGIAKATGEVSAKLPKAFAVAGGGPALASAGGGGTPIVINLTYQPMVSTANQMEVEKALMPTILEGIRKARKNGLV